MNIIEEIKGQDRDLGQKQINKIIRDTLHTLNKESDYEISAEFLIVQYIKKSIRIWKNTNGYGHSVNSKKIHAIGMFRSILPHLTTELESIPIRNALSFGLELLGWASIIENSVGDPQKMGCNICVINNRGMKIDVEYVEPNIEKLRYSFDRTSESQSDSRLKGTIRIGYISASTAGLQIDVPFVENIIEHDLNIYASKLGYDVNFEFLIDNANGQAAVHLQKVQQFNSIGVKCFIGGGWSSQALVSKNELEQIRYEAQQQIIQAEAAKNATIRRAEGDALARIIEANSTAKAIEIITLQMTDEYASYLWLQQWDGRLPAVMTRDEQGLIIDASDFINP